MKVDSYIKEFLQDEKIKELINENKIEEVFNIFYDLIFYKNRDKIDSSGELAKQFYDLIEKLNIKYEKGPISKKLEFVSKMIGKKVEWLAKGKNHKQGTIADISMLIFDDKHDDVCNFNNALFMIDFDDGTFEEVRGTLLNLIR